jgi:hypothetical protein
MRESWTDERLDDFRDEVNRRFDRVEGDIRDMRTEMNGRFDALQRTMILFCGGIVTALLGLIATQL